MRRDNSESSLHISLLGHPRILSGSERVTALRAKSQALLFYLATTGAAQPRSTLASLFWPLADEKQANTSLRTALTDLRRLIEPHLEVTRQAVSLRRESLYLDVAQFDRLLKRTGNLEIDALQMQAAVSLYGGDFLEGFSLPDAPLLEQWIIIERVRLREAMQGALLSLARWHVDQDDYGAALDHLTRLLAIEPANEAGHRQKMIVLARMGQRSAALQQFEACRRALQQELDVDPAPDTVAVYELILAGALGAQPSGEGGVAAGRPLSSALGAGGAGQPALFVPEAQPVQPSDLPDRSAFYGRREDLAQLTRWLTSDGAGLVAISGLGGAGKTSLTLELIARLPVGSFDAILWRSLVNAPSLETVVDDWLKQLVPHYPFHLPASLDDKLALLFDDLQRHRCLLVLDNAESIIDENGGRWRTGYEEYASLILRMSQYRSESCLLLTSRELPAGLLQLHEDFPRVRLLALAGLPVGPGIELLRHRGITAADAALKLLVERYSGNPLALKLVADTVRDLFGSDVDAYLGNETPVFGDIRKVLAEQFARLSALEREIVVWLAIEREPATIDSLWRDLARPPQRWQFLETIGSLQRRSLVEETAGEVPGRALRLSLQNVVMQFVTDRLIETVFEEIDSGQLDWLHRYALVKTQSQEYVQASQRRMLLHPVADKLAHDRGAASAAARLRRVLDRLRADQAGRSGYAGANVLHLLLHLGADLRGADFSGMALWQADLRKAALPAVDFGGVDFAGSVFSNTFGAVAVVAVSPDGETVAAGGTDGVVHIWQISDYQPVRVLRRSGNTLTALAFSDDGRYLASGGLEEDVCIWDIQSGEMVRLLHLQSAPIQTWSLAMHGEHLAVAYVDKTVHVWNWELGESKLSFALPGLVHAVAFSPDGRLLAAAGQGLEFCLWDLDTGELLHSQLIDKGRNLAAAFSPDGRTLATGGEDTHIRLWDVDQMQVRRVLQGHSGWVLALRFLPDGRRLVSASADHTACLWDTAVGEPVQSFVGHSGWVRTVACLPDGRGVVTGGDDQTVRVWDTDTGELRHYLQGNMRWVDLVRFSRDGLMLASSSIGSEVRIWDVATGGLLHHLPTEQVSTRAMAFSSDNRLLACGNDDHTARVWNTQTGVLAHAFRGHQAPVREIAFSPDDRYLVTGSHDDTVRIWEIATGQQRLVITHASALLQYALAFHPAGHTLAVATLDHSIKLVNLHSLQVVDSIPTGDGIPNVVTFDCSGNTLACGARDGAVLLWEISVESPDRIRIKSGPRSLRLQQEAIWRLQFSPDGRLLVCISEAPKASVLDVLRGEELFTVPSRYGAFCLDFSPDGRLLVAADYDHAAQIRDAATGVQRRTLRGHTSALTSLSFSVHGNTVASSSADGSVRLWNGDTGDCLHVLEPLGPYAGMNIAGATGITAAQRATLMTLGAVEAT